MTYLMLEIKRKINGKMKQKPTQTLSANSYRKEEDNVE